MSLQKNVLVALLAAAAVMMPSGAMAQDYSTATRLGPVDLQLACPTDSKWDPRNGGECRTCPASFEMVLFECRRAILPRLETAPDSGKRRSLFGSCPSGTFRAGVTRRCHYCPGGLTHNPALPVEVPGVCFAPPRLEKRPAKVVKKLSLEQLVTPSRLIGEIGDLGCEAYADGAFFDLTGGGTCWQCPADNPVRTLSPVTGSSACVDTECGGHGDRACYVFERFPGCRGGLVIDPSSGSCVTPEELACLPMFDVFLALRELTIAVETAEEDVKQLALDEIPGLNVIAKSIEAQIGHAEKAMAQTTKLVKPDHVLASIGDAFDSPEVARQLERVMSRIAARKDEFLAQLLDSGSICAGDFAAIIRLMDQVMLAENDDAGRSFGLLDLLGPTRANASERPLLAGWTFAVTTHATLHISVQGYTLPATFGVQLSTELGEAKGKHKVMVHYVFGADIVNQSKPGFSNDLLVSFSPPSDFCNAFGSFGAGAVFAERVGVGLSCDGYSFSYNLATFSMSPDVKFTFGKTQMKDLFNKFFKGQGEEGQAFTLGPNFSLVLAGGSSVDPSFAY